jgi:hypothetical protein
VAGRPWEGRRLVAQDAAARRKRPELSAPKKGGGTPPLQAYPTVGLPPPVSTTTRVPTGVRL